MITNFSALLSENATVPQIITILIAYAIGAVGPLALTYMYVKNVNKILAAGAKAISKVGSRATKASMKSAKNRFDRSTFGAARGARKQARDVAAQQRAYGRLGGGVRGGLASLGLDKDARKAFKTRVSGLNTAVYDKEVEDETNRLGRSEHGQNLDAAVSYARKLAASGTATKAQMQAAANNVLSHKGGKTNLRNLFRDQKFMADVAKRDESWDGLARAALTSKGFADAHPDIANAIMQHESAFRTETQKATTGAVKTETYADSFGTHTRTLSNADAFLGANFSTTATAPGTGGKVVANGVKNWNWIAERPGQILAASDAHVPHLAGNVEYQYAKAAQESPEFGNADPRTKTLSMMWYTVQKWQPDQACQQTRTSDNSSSYVPPMAVYNLLFE